MADQELCQIAFEGLNRMMKVIEHSDPRRLSHPQIRNYFLICRELEKSQARYRALGMILAHDPERGAYLSSLTVNPVEDTVDRLANRLLVMFCRPTVPDMSFAVNEYITYFGVSRFVQFVREMGATKNFDLKSVVGRAYENGFSIEGPVFMDVFESVALSPRGMSRVYEKIHEFLLEDYCADTMVVMLASENKLAECYTEIKEAILERLEAKFSAQPERRLWLMLACSPSLISAVNSFPPFVSFVLKVIRKLSASVTLDPTTGTYRSPRGSLKYKDLVQLIAMFYRNPQTKQDIVNFVFDQFKVDPQVWCSILTACHNFDPPDDSTTDRATPALLDSLYTDQLTN